MYVSSGTLNLGFNAPIAGTYDAESGGEIAFNQGNFTLGSHNFNGAGTIALTGGALTLSGTPDLRNLNFLGGTILGTFSQPGDFNLAGSTLAGNATVGGNFNMSGGMLTGTVNQIGDFNWSGGAIANAITNTINAGQTLNQSNATWLSGGTTLTNNSTANITGALCSGYGFDTTPNTINNVGTLNLTGGIFGNWAEWWGYPYANAAFILNNSGTMNLSDGSTIVGGGSSTLTNTGLIQSNGNTSIWVGGGYDNSAGTIAINSGTLNLGFNGEIAGTYQTSFGAELNFNQGDFTMGSHSFTGAGTFALTGGTLLLSGTPDLTSLNLWGGTITGNFNQPGDFNLAGSTMAGNATVNGNFNMSAGMLTGTVNQVGDFNWSGGVIANAVTNTINAGQTLNQSNATCLSGGTILTNNSTANIGGTLYSGYNGDRTPNTVNNNGVLNLTGAIAELTPWWWSSYGWAAFTLNNSGTINLSDGSSISGNSSTLINTGLIQSDGNTSIWMGGGYDNSLGTIAVSTGTLNLGFNGEIAGIYQTNSGAELNFNQGDFTLGSHSFTGAGTFALTGGTLLLSGTPDLTNLNLWGGTITGTFSQPGDFNLAGSTLAGNATVGGNFNMSAGILTGTVNQVGDFNWSGGAIANAVTNTINAGQTLNQSNSTWLSGGSILTNNNTVNIAGTLYSGYQGDTTANTFNNAGTLNLTGSIAEHTNQGWWSSYYYGSAPLTLNNSGTLNLSDGSSIYGPSTALMNTGLIQSNGNTSIFAGGLFENAIGTVSVVSGTLNLGFDGQIAGTYEAGSGAELNFNQGNFTIGAHSFTGAGTFALTGGNLQLSGTPDLTNLNFLGGTILGNFSQPGDFNLAGSTLAGNATVGGDFNMSAGILTGTVSQVGDFNWSGGVISNAATTAVISGQSLNQSNTTWLSGGSTLTNNGTANIAGTLYSGYQGDTTANTINNAGTMNLTGSIVESTRYWWQYYNNGSAAFTLSNSGTMNLADGSSISGGSSTLINTGLIQSNGNTSIWVGGGYNNSLGTIAVSTGTLNLGFNGEIAGTYRTNSGAELNFNQGNFTLGSHTFAGAGTFALTGGTLQLSGTPDLTNLNLWGGTITGNFSQPGDFNLAGSTLAGNATVGGNLNLSAGMLTGTVAQAGDFNWSGGVISNAATTAVISGQSLNQSNTTWLSGGSTLTNNGTANIAGTLYSGYQGDTTANTINNAGTMNLTGSIVENTNTPWWYYYNGSAAFALNNSGTMNLSDGSSISGNSSTLNNTGMINLYDNVSISGSALSLTNSGLIQKNSGSGTSSIWAGGSFDNSLGTIAVSTGTLNLGFNGEIAGTYRTNSGAELDFNQGNFTLGSHSFAGAGTFALTGGTLQLAGTPDLTSLNLWGGAITGSFSIPGDLNLAGSTLAGNATVGGNLNISAGMLTGTVAQAGDFNWSGGVISNAATTAVISGQSLNQSNTTWLSGGSTLTNNGTANIAGTLYSGYQGDTTANTINNAGTMNLTGSIMEHTNQGWWSYYYGSAPLTLNNSGTMNLSDGSSISGGSSTLINTGLIAERRQYEHLGGRWL